jgi:predicted metal-dependent hydrolase
MPKKGTPPAAVQPSKTDYSDQILKSVNNNDHLSQAAEGMKLKANFMSRKLINKPFTEVKEKKWWLNNSTSCTEFMHALSILFPEGEAFFVRAVAQFSKNPLITGDPVLAADVKAFITQEAQHAGEHSAYNREIGRRYKHDQEKMTRLVKWILSLSESYQALTGSNLICLGITCSLGKFWTTRRIHCL